MTTNGLQDLITRQQSGRSLEREFYLDPAIWALDVERVLSNKWHQVGHVALVPDPGDYFVVELLGESIIVVRGDDDEIRALYNVCRHRGAQLCSAANGNKALFTCPYHGWTYRLDGALAAAPLMAADFDPADHALSTCHVRVLEGIIFINFAETAPDFDRLFATYAPLLRFYGLAHAKIAMRRRFSVAANWKLVVENGLECYHCFGVHPVFAKVRSRAQNRSIGTDETTCPPQVQAQYAAEYRQWRESLTQLPEYAGALVDDDEHSDHLRSLIRTPLAQGYVTESVDGKPVAPLMGEFEQYDNATTISLFNPWSWIFASSDHAVTLRWAATGVDSTEVEMIWLVSPSAEENTDYDPQHVARIQWDTALEDKAIVESVRNGIASRSYRPGRLSRQEATVDRFVRWYLRQLSTTNG